MAAEIRGFNTTFETMKGMVLCCLSMRPSMEGRGTRGPTRLCLSVVSPRSQQGGSHSEGTNRRLCANEGPRSLR